MGFHVNKTGEFVFGVTTFLMLPVVVNAVGVVVVKTNANIWHPSAGGVIVAIATVPVMNVRNVDGATIAAEAIVTGFGIIPDCGRSRVLKLRSLLGIVNIQ
jgi:hypothetical protein